MSLIQVLAASGQTALVGAFNPSDKAANVTLSNSNLTMANSTGTTSSVRTTSSVSSGKHYFEFVVLATGTELFVGVANSSAPLSSIPGVDPNGISVQCSGASAGAILYNNLLFRAPYQISGATVSDVIGVKVDLSAGTFAVNRNGGTFGSNMTTIPTGPLFIMAGSTSNGSCRLSYTPTYAIPSGYTYWGN